MNSLQQLEYPKIKVIIANECHSEIGGTLAEKLHPLQDKKAIETKLAISSEIQEYLMSNNSFNFEELSCIDDLLRKPKQQIYDFDEFKMIISNISITNKLKLDEEIKEDYSLLSKKFEKIIILPELEKRFYEIFNVEGDVKDTASPLLQKLRSKRKRVRRDTIAFLNKKLLDLESNNQVFDKIVTQRDGRFVVPIKESSTSFIKGIVHGKSASKSSVFIEPEEVISKNNELEIISSEEKAEIFRIFQVFSKSIMESKEEILSNTEAAIELDFLFAVGRLSNRYKAESPYIINEAKLELYQARHPLLIETLGSVDKVIPFNLKLGEDYKMLVISGPNTGGKTVTLKTVGLLTIMALSGLPIPAAADSKIGLFNKFFADIGDFQSLEDSLSTFSSHIKNIDGMITDGDAFSLVVIDEIGAATDPEQGSALAQSIMERLVKQNVTGIITTHYTALKLFAESNDNCINAAMQFDPDKHSPTYHFKLGLPGNSFAIEVASQLGLHEDIIARAKELTGSQSIELTELLRKISEEKKQVAHEHYQHKLKNALLNKKIEEHHAKIEELERNNKTIRKQSLKEARAYLTKIQKEINNQLDEIKKMPKNQRKNNLAKSLNTIFQLNTDIGKEEDQLIPTKGKPIKNPEIGMAVWVKDFDSEGEIIEIKNNAVVVDINGIRYTTRLSKIFEIANQKKSKAKITAPKIKTPKKQAKMEILLLGYRFDEAKSELDDFIDNADMNDLKMLRIVHGKGTGALRSKVRQYLRRHKKIKEFYTPPPEVGGDGVTIAILKEETDG